MPSPYIHILYGLAYKILNYNLLYSCILYNYFTLSPILHNDKYRYMRSNYR